MIIESAWGQLLFFKYVKLQSGKRFGHRCGPSSVPDFYILIMDEKVLVLCEK